MEVFLLIVVAVFIVLRVLNYIDNKRLWNNGYCACGKKWMYIGQDARGERLYKCESCKLGICVRH